MATETYKTIELPQGFSYSRAIGPFSLSTELIAGKGIGKVYERANASLPRVILDELYCLGRDLEWNLADPELLERVPPEARELGRLVFRRMQERNGEGVFHNDYVFFEPEVQTIRNPVHGILKRPGDEYIAGRLFHDAVGEEKSGRFYIKDAKLETQLWLPYGDGRIIVPAENSINSQFGLPDATEKNPDNAREMIAERFGISDELVTRLMSKFYRTDNDWAVVESWSSVVGGPGCVDLNRWPLDGSWGGGTGRLVASRSRKTDAEGVD